MRYLVALFAALGCLSPVAAQSIVTLTVSRVIDGDTLDATDGRRIRLMGIDAPELAQPSGFTAKDRLELFALDRAVDVLRIRHGSFGRYDAILRWRGRNINEQMVESGYAWVDPRYCPRELVTPWSTLMVSAQQTGRGLWSIANPVSPWDYRLSRTGRAEDPTVQPVTLIDPQPVLLTMPTTSGCRIIDGRLVCPQKRPAYRFR